MFSYDLCCQEGLNPPPLTFARHTLHVNLEVKVVKCLKKFKVSHFNA